MKLGILILHFNTPKHTSDLCKIIPEAIVIDNGSDAGKEYTGPNRVIRFETNQHFTRGWNEGVKAVYDEFDAFWLCNSDIKLARKDITRVHNVLEHHPEAMLFTPVYNCWVYWANQRNSKGLREVPMIEFTAPVIRKEVYEAIGFFDERFKRGFGVEFDFCYKMRKLGLKIFADDLSSFIHIGQCSRKDIPDYNREAIFELINGINEIYGPDWKSTIFDGVDLDYNYNYRFNNFGNISCVYTTIFGNYDKLKPVPKQTGAPADYICITDNPEVKCPGWKTVVVNFPNKNLSARMRAKYFKILFWEHPELNSYYNIIFIDASIRIKSDKFVATALAGLKDIKIFRHPERNNIQDEVLRSGTLVKYNNEPIFEQTESYINAGLPDNNLYAGGIIARKNRLIVHNIMRSWWHENIKWSYQDQLSMPYVFWKHGFTPQLFSENQAKNSLFDIIWHDDNNEITHLAHPVKEKKQFSIVINVHKSTQKDCEHTIKSIQNQTFKDFELVLIDNAIDESDPLLDYIYALDDSNIKIIRQSKPLFQNRIPAVAKKHSSGNKIVYIKPGEVWAANYLEFLLKK